MVAVAEIAQVDEVALAIREDGIAELKVAVDCGVFVGGVGYEFSNLVLFFFAEERVLLQQLVVTVFYVFEFVGIHMCGM